MHDLNRVEGCGICLLFLGSFRNSHVCLEWLSIKKQSKRNQKMTTHPWDGIGMRWYQPYHRWVFRPHLYSKFSLISPASFLTVWPQKNTCQSTQSNLCGSSCFSWCLHEVILASWHSHTQTQRLKQCPLQVRTLSVYTLDKDMIYWRRLSYKSHLHTTYTSFNICLLHLTAGWTTPIFKMSLYLHTC